MKLLELQKRIAPITKDTENPFFKSRYFDVNKVIEVIKPILNELELVIVQPLSNVNGKPAIRTMVIDATTGDVLVEDTVTLPELGDPQKMGSAITYFRRYALQSLLLLEAEDDDANTASQPQQMVQRPERPFMQNFNGGKSVPKGGTNEEFNPGELKTINYNEM